MDHEVIMQKKCAISRVPMAFFFLTAFLVVFARPSGAAGDVIILGMSAGFKGPTRGLAAELYRGAMAYFERVNAQGGVNHRKIEIKALNDGYDPLPAIRNTIELVEKDKVLALFDYLGTPTVTRVLPLLKNYLAQDVYLFFPFTGAQPQREPPYDAFVFNLRASYRQEVRALTNSFIGIGRPRIAVFYQADAYGRSGWDGTRRALDDHGLRIVAEATYRRGAMAEESMARQVEVIKNVEPDAVISIGAYPACAAFIRDARLAGLDVPIANVSFVGSDALLRALEAEGKRLNRDLTVNLINTQVVPSYQDVSLPAVREYRELMDQYGDKRPPGLMEGDYEPFRYSFVSFEGFLNAKVMTTVLEGMRDPLDRIELQRAVENLRDLDIGIGDPVCFGPQRHQGLDKVFFTKVKDGRFVTLKDFSEFAK
jgi:branched-chain amino acid transport system substrate-binding protein